DGLEVLDHLRRREARAYGVDADVEPYPLDGERLGQSDHAVLGGDVPDISGECIEARPRRHVYDRTLLHGDHRRPCYELRPEEWRVEVHCLEALPRLR